LTNISIASGCDADFKKLPNESFSDCFSTANEAIVAKLVSICTTDYFDLNDASCFVTKVNTNKIVKK
jgi:hypothetical protein